MSKLIETRPPSGFRDYAPEQMIPKERLLQTAREVCRSYGFTPIDTPAVESLEVLLGKGGEESDKLVYRVRGAKSEVEETGLRFDLTVPFARFAARYVPGAGTPFKRYATGPVWRGERPGQGRYREFWQFDFDTIGTKSNAADIEIVLLISDLFDRLELPRIEIRMNNRMVLNGLLESIGLSDKSVPLLRSLDKLPKIGRDKVIEEMVREAGVTAEQATRVLVLAETTGTSAEVLDRVEREFGSNARTAEGVRRLRELVAVCDSAGVPDSRVKIDLSIARGLDYYTGTIYETFMTDLPDIGSVCSGGRYDNLAGLYTRLELPGVGASVGVDRLLTAMEELKHPWMSGGSTPAQVLVLQFDATRLGDYQRVARELRATGVATEVYPEAKKLKAQFEYADKRGFRLALIAGSEEFASGMWKIKDLAKREEVAVPVTELVPAVTNRLRSVS